MRSKSRTFVGVMTGTSVDGLDIAAIKIDHDEKIEFITIICGTGLLICSNLTLLDLKKNDKNKSLLSNN